MWGFFTAGWTWISSRSIYWGSFVAWSIFLCRKWKLTIKLFFWKICLKKKTSGVFNFPVDSAFSQNTRNRQACAYKKNENDQSPWSSRLKCNIWEENHFQSRSLAPSLILSLFLLLSLSVATSNARRWKEADKKNCISLLGQKKNSSNSLFLIATAR